MRKAINITVLWLVMFTDITGFGQILWGANAHPIQGGAYINVSFDEQMSLLNQMGITAYRMDLHNDSNSQTQLTNVIPHAKSHGITVLPALLPDQNPADYANQTDAYNAGLSIGTTFAQLNKNNNLGINTWELGNEMDNEALTGGTCQAGDGSNICQYNLTSYGIEKELILGMLAGIHSVNPSALAIVNSAGWCHYAFQSQLLADGVNFNLTGWHWYKNMQNSDITSANCTAGPTNILAILKGWGRPIWLTEFGDNQDTDPSLQGNWLTLTMMPEWMRYASTYNIASAFIYQLLDMKDVTTYCNSHPGDSYCLGLADMNGNLLSSGMALENASMSPNPLNFGVLLEGGPPVNRTVTVSNQRTSQITISSITSSGEFVLTSKTCGATLPALANCSVTITFDPGPLPPGSYTGTLTVNDSAANNPQTAPISASVRCTGKGC